MGEDRGDQGDAPSLASRGLGGPPAACALELPPWRSRGMAARGAHCASVVRVLFFKGARREASLALGGWKGLAAVLHGSSRAQAPSCRSRLLTSDVTFLVAMAFSQYLVFLFEIVDSALLLAFCLLLAFQGFAYIL